MKRVITRTLSPAINSITVSLVFVLFLAACQKEIKAPMAKEQEPLSATPKYLRLFNQVNLVANSATYNPMRVEEDLINAWGIAFSPGGVAWVNAEGGGESYVLNRNTGADIIPAVEIPSPAGPEGGHPTGIVFNGTSGFKLTNGNPARFIFVGVDGIISGWNGGAAAEKVIDNSSWAAYTGLAILTTQSGATYLYAANFRNRSVDVYDTNWNQVKFPFKDPNSPIGYAPFNVENIDNEIFVAMAQVNPADGHEVFGSGKGFINVFNGFGAFRRRFASRGPLNAPWGITKAPASFFGSGSPVGARGAILVGNFGDGHISVYLPDGTELGYLNNNQQPLWIDGLWDIAFAPAGATGNDPNQLFFAAGPNSEADGVFGFLRKADLPPVQ